MRKLRAGLVIALASACVVSTQPSVTSAAPARVPGVDGNGHVTDPRLLHEIEHARQRRTERNGAVATVPVEILTDDVAGVSARVRAAGGTVTGSVPGAVVQATVPFTAADGLAAVATVEQVQYPRRAGYAPGTPLRRTDGVSPGFGPSVGDEVTKTAADAWHVQGFDGTGVKVGIVDYFDFTVWNVNEQGALPDPAHQFCRDTLDFVLCNGDGTIANAPVFNTEAGRHGVAVSEIVKDMAPGAQLYVASVGTVSDLAAAIDWFAANGVPIVTRSLGAAYDGPGDGTGPLAGVVDLAVSKGITWFNSAGNDAFDAYLRRTITGTTGGYVNFNDGRAGAGVDTWLRVDSTAGCYFLDGIRWANDWYLPASSRTDYSIEFYEPTVDVSTAGDHYNPTAGQAQLIASVDASQRLGAPPLEAADQPVCPSNQFSPYPQTSSISYIRIKRNAATPVGGSDTIEVALPSNALMELNYSDAVFSGAKPVVDSRNPGLVAVGAVDPTAKLDPNLADSIAYYSSQGPTNDGRVKPDVSAPAGFASTIFGTFQGTSAASPTAAGFAALLQGAGLGQPGAGLAALVKHFVTDLGPAGPDNAYGTGLIHLPPPPSAPAAATPGRYVPMAVPERVLDTRQGSFHVGPLGTVGPYAPQSIFEFDIRAWSTIPSGASVSAVAVNLTSVSPPSVGFVQAYPYLRARNGGTSTLNISTVNVARPNFAIVPVGQDGNISVYAQAGGNVIIDLLGYYVDGQTTPADGRFVPLGTPERWMDTRSSPLPSSFAGTPRPLLANETVSVPVLAGTAVPDLSPGSSTVEALVVNIAAVNAAGAGFLRAVPGGIATAAHANVNYVPGSASANTAIVPLGAGGTIDVFTSQNVDVIVDVVGYITSGAAPAAAAGTFVPLTPTRAYDTRAIAQPFTAGETRGFYITGGTTGVPDGIGGVSANLTVVAPAANGFLKVYPGLVPPPTASVNYAAGKTVANGALMGVNQIGVSNSVTAAMSQSGHLIIDINGYFVAAST